MKLIAPGSYKAYITDWGVPESDKQHAQVGVVFEVEIEEGVRKQITYFGSLHPNAAEYTISNLITCGLKGTDLSKIELGAEGEALAFGKELQVVIEHDTYNGKTTAKISFINNAGGSKFKAMEPIQAKEKLGGFKGLVSKLRAESGVKASVPPKQEDSVGF